MSGSNDSDIFQLIRNGERQKLNDFLERNVINAATYNIDGHTPLTFACENDNKHAVCRLLNIYSNVNDKNRQGNPPILYAAALCSEDILKILLNCKADINAKGKNGETALHWAIRNERVTIVRLLLELGINVCEKKRFSIGRNPLDLAEEVGSEKIYNMLVSSMEEGCTRSCTAIEKVQELRTLVEGLSAENKLLQGRLSKLEKPLALIEGLSAENKALQERISKFEKCGKKESPPPLPKKLCNESKSRGMSRQSGVVSSSYITPGEAAKIVQNTSINPNTGYIEPQKTEQRKEEENRVSFSLDDNETMVKSTEDPNSGDKTSSDDHVYVKLPEKPRSSQTIKAQNTGMTLPLSAP